MQESFEYLWDRIRQGDEKAFDVLFKELYPGLCRFAQRLLGSMAEAEETVQDVFVNIWQNRKRITLTGSLKSYLYQGVHNLAFNRIEHFKTLKFKPNRTADFKEWMEIHNSYLVEDTFIKTLEAEETSILIKKAIAELPAKCREIFLLSREEELSYEQISERLELSQNTVRVQIFRALVFIREYLTKFNL